MMRMRKVGIILYCETTSLNKCCFNFALCPGITPVTHVNISENCVLKATTPGYHTSTILTRIRKRRMDPSVGSVLSRLYMLLAMESTTQVTISVFISFS